MFVWELSFWQDITDSYDIPEQAYPACSGIFFM